MTFDNADELYKIARAHPRAKCVVRILTDDSKSLCAFGIKFGAPLATVPGLLAKAKELDLDVIGVSFHVGSGCYDPSVYTDAINRARSVFEMGKQAGYTFKLLDVGGGFEDSLFEEAATVLKQAIDLHFPDRHGLKIIAEPGRFYVSKAFRLAANVIARRAPLPGPGVQEPINDEPVAMCTLRYFSTSLLLKVVPYFRLHQWWRIRRLQLYSLWSPSRQSVCSIAEWVFPYLSIGANTRQQPMGTYLRLDRLCFF